jgi:hypothetical protein
MINRRNLFLKSIFSFKSKFTQEEDNYLIQLVQQFGTRNWKLISEKIKIKNSRQCQDRWNNFLDPKINKMEWSEEEDQQLLQKVKEIGNKWMKISKCFNHRTDIQCKNRFNKLQRKLKKMDDLNFQIQQNDPPNNDDQDDETKYYFMQSPIAEFHEQENEFFHF